MARARNIKPGFFRNADLVELPFEARLLFIGLWTIADREGRMLYRPKQIKMELFPADNVDCDALVAMLENIGMVEVYEIDGIRYLHVINFVRHQNPHRDEKASTLPDKHGNYSTSSKAQCKHSASTVQARCDEDADTMPIGLIPDSLNLKPSKPSASASQIADSQPEKRKPAIQFKTFVSECRESGQKLIPEDDPVFDWADKAGVPDDFLRLAWLEFRDRYGGSTKRYRDWRHVFRNAVRDNWYGIWFCDESGKMVLTSKGRTIQQTMREAA